MDGVQGIGTGFSQGISYEMLMVSCGNEGITNAYNTK